jgi:hypothetical protein
MIVTSPLGLPGAPPRPVKNESGRKKLSNGQVWVAVVGALLGSLVTTTPILSWLSGTNVVSAGSELTTPIVPPPAPPAQVVSPVVAPAVSPITEGVAATEVIVAVANKDISPALETTPFDKWLDPDQTYPRRRVMGVEVNGQIHGEVRSVDAKRRLISTEHYQQGVRVGLRVDYYPSGAKFADYTYDEAGLPQGVSRRWFENGEVAQEMHFKDSVAHGAMTMYYTNGRPSQIGTIVAGKAQGPRKHYLSDGRLYGVSTMKDGESVRDSVVLQISEQEAEEVGERARWSPRLRSYWE